MLKAKIKRQILSLFKNTAPATDYSALGVDMHSHLLPGIDDGAEDLEESLDLIRALRKLGYRHLITTPHVYQEYFPNTTAVIREKEAEVKAAIAQEGIDVTLQAAAEYMLDEGFAARLQDDDLLTLGERHVLVELGFLAEPPGVEETFFELRTKGYRPVLAHAERYLYLADDLDRFARLREMGVWLQLNLLSFTGHYGSPVQKLAKRLLKAGYIDLLGTDCHHLAHTMLLKKALKEKGMQKLLKQEWKNRELKG